MRENSTTKRIQKSLRDREQSISDISTLTGINYTTAAYTLRELFKLESEE